GACTPFNVSPQLIWTTGIWAKTPSKRRIRRVMPRLRRARGLGPPGWLTPALRRSLLVVCPPVLIGLMASVSLPDDHAQTVQEPCAKRNCVRKKRYAKTVR